MSERLELLQAGRAVAALSVAVFHATLYTHAMPIEGFGFMGVHWGVHFFFLLSGFIIYHVNADRSFAPGDYAFKRSVRIFIPYLPVGILAAFGWIAIGRDFSWLSTLFLVPGQAALGVAWTLQHEVMFYLLAGLFFMWGRPLTGAAIWAVLILLRNGISIPVNPFEQVALGFINLEFVAGMFLAAFVSLPDVKVGRALNLLGDASYAIYLAHLPLMGVLFRLGGGFWTMLALSVAAGLIYHLLFEKPALRWVRSSRFRERPAIGRVVARGDEDIVSGM
ncbi:MAG TPA: acyltransferase family protein [Allosphingosinicella sp.]|nr:acyltransferase family protein [Allosphingosinicella sp.]